MSGRSKITTDHKEIRRWIEERGGEAATVKSTADNGSAGILRVDYPGYSGEDTLKRIDWDTFFEAFEKNNLAFLYQDDPDSRFSKFIDRDSAKQTKAAEN